MEFLRAYSASESFSTHIPCIICRRSSQRFKLSPNRQHNPCIQPRHQPHIHFTSLTPDLHPSPLNNLKLLQIAGSCTPNTVYHSLALSHCRTMCFMIYQPADSLTSPPWLELGINTDREKTHCSYQESSNQTSKTSGDVPFGLSAFARKSREDDDICNRRERGDDRDDGNDGGDDDKNTSGAGDDTVEDDEDEDDAWLEEEILKMNRILTYEKWQKQRTVRPARDVWRRRCQRRYVVDIERKRWSRVRDDTRLKRRF